MVVIARKLLAQLFLARISESSKPLKKWLISSLAVSAPSEPCAALRSMPSPNLCEIVPGAALAGSVAPHQLAVLRDGVLALETLTSTGPLIMILTRSTRKTAGLGERRRIPAALLLDSQMILAAMIFRPAFSKRPRILPMWPFSTASGFTIDKVRSTIDILFQSPRTTACGGLMTTTSSGSPQISGAGGDRDTRRRAGRRTSPSAVPLPPGDDGAGMAHALARRGGGAGDEGGDGLLQFSLMKRRPPPRRCRRSRRS